MTGLIYGLSGVKIRNWWSFARVTDIVLVEKPLDRRPVLKDES